MSPRNEARGEGWIHTETQGGGWRGTWHQRLTVVNLEKMPKAGCVCACVVCVCMCVCVCGVCVPVLMLFLDWTDMQKAM